MKLVELNAPNTLWNEQVQTEIVEVLEAWLADAKAGKFEGIAICGVHKTGAVETNVPCHNQHPALIGAAGLLHYRLMTVESPVPVE
jgi:hypothetical protein